MLSLTGEYAMRAIIYIARNVQQCPLSGARIASETAIPRKYLAKVLTDLVRSNVLRSSPGRNGGFSLRRTPKKTTLHHVLAPFLQLERKQCVFGITKCSPSLPCAAHAKWKTVLDGERRFLRETTVYDVSAEYDADSGNQEGTK